MPPFPWSAPWLTCVCRNCVRICCARRSTRNLQNLVTSRRFCARTSIWTRHHPSILWRCSSGAHLLLGDSLVGVLLLGCLPRARAGKAGRQVSRYRVRLGDRLLHRVGVVHAGASCTSERGMLQRRYYEDPALPRSICSVVRRTEHGRERKCRIHQTCECDQGLSNWRPASFSRCGFCGRPQKLRQVVCHCCPCNDHGDSHTGVLVRWSF
mmetsp:Transcript_105011/g.295676  ORF Transcript_105011/g.295676 Transcript_105011/m.295676 type:complete len:210 (+) Transcript_105011:344-973(+)